MEEGNKPNPAIPIDEQGNAVIAEHNGILGLPKEIIIEIIKLVFSASSSNRQLGQLVTNLSRLNKFFDNFLKGDSQELVLLWMIGLKKIEPIKSEIYKGSESLVRHLPNGLKQWNGIKTDKGTKINLLCELLHLSMNARELLFAAVKAGDLDKSILALKYVDANARDLEDTRALMIAAQKGHKEIVELLLLKGADVNAKDMYGQTALWLAAEANHQEVVKLLILKNAKLEEKDVSGYTPLMIAVYKGYKETIKLLFEGGADLKVTDMSGRNLMELAHHSDFSKDDLELINLLAKYMNKKKKSSCIIS